MCGIAGIVSPSGVDRRLLDQFGTVLQHRGPDGQGVWIDERNRIGFVHRRLAIIDLTPTGEQPMQSKDGRWTLSFNGEIYNHGELRTRLDPSGGWRGTSDTETLLAAISAWGIEAAIDAAVGMFAISLFDARNRQLHLIRDRFGEKPLYYGWCGGDLVFASELKAIRAHPDFDGALDPAAVEGMLRFAAVPAPRSIYREVRKLPPASHATIAVDGDLRDVKIARYWSYEDLAVAGAVDPYAGEADARDALEAALAASIGGQAVADVPVGAFLSGGIDSSTVVALYRKYTTGTIRTFSIGFAEDGFNEAIHAREVAAYLGTTHEERIVTAEDAMAVIPRLPQMFDEPFADASQIPTYLVSALARERVTVALSGDGGDELLGGYNRHIGPPRLWSKVSRLPSSARALIGAGAGAIPPAAWDWALATTTGKRGVRRGTKLRRAVMTSASGKSLGALYADLIDAWPGASPVDVPYATHAPAALALDPASEMMVRDVDSYLPDDVLVKVDRAAMACSLETRAPFLDHRLAAVTARIPTRFKIRGGTGKAILRDLLYANVPRALVDRPKAGFSVPIGAWLRVPLRDWAEDLLSPSALAVSGLIAISPARDRWQRYLLGQEGHDQALWSLLMFQAWLADAKA